jgi:hypothetical protein
MVMPPVNTSYYVDCLKPSSGTATTPQSASLLSSGELSATQLSGWTEGNTFLKLAYDYHGQISMVVPADEWYAQSGVGRLSRADGFPSTQAAAENLMFCLTERNYDAYSGRTDLISEPTMVDGSYAWHLRSKIYVSAPANVVGDQVDLYIVDFGNGSDFGFYVGACTIGDTASCQAIQDAITSLQVG